MPRILLPGLLLNILLKKVFAFYSPDLLFEVLHYYPFCLLLHVNPVLRVWENTDGWEILIAVVSAQFNGSVMSDSLQPHGLQYARLPCPSHTPEACSNSYPLSQWCHRQRMRWLDSSEQRSTHIISRSWLPFFWIYIQSRIARSYDSSLFNFEEHPYCSPWQLHNFTFLPMV